MHIYSRCCCAPLVAFLVGSAVVFGGYVRCLMLSVNPRCFSAGRHRADRAVRLLQEHTAAGATFASRPCAGPGSSGQAHKGAAGAGQDESHSARNHRVGARPRGKAGRFGQQERRTQFREQAVLSTSEEDQLVYGLLADVTLPASGVPPVSLLLSGVLAVVTLQLAAPRGAACQPAKGACTPACQPAKGACTPAGLARLSARARICVQLRLCGRARTCVTTGPRHLDRLGQLGEFEQESNTGWDWRVQSLDGRGDSCTVSFCFRLGCNRRSNPVGGQQNGARCHVVGLTVLQQRQGLSTGVASSVSSGLSVLVTLSQRRHTP